MTQPRWIDPDSADWPARLTHLESPPEGLWRLGTVGVTTPSVAIVGSRRATFAGVEIAASIARELGSAGIQVISGMALGIDAAAHTGALDAGGSTIAVLGCGIDVCYPPRHTDLRARIIGSGSLISEEPAGTPPFKYNFPKRNRIIAALAQAVVVVEATERSGALSTARWAADLGREVLAVPGSIRSRQSSGTNLLIRDGVRPFLGIADLLEAVPELCSSAPDGSFDSLSRDSRPRSRAFQPTAAGDTGTHGNRTGPPGPGRVCPGALTVAGRQPAGCAGACRSRNVPARRPRGPYRITGARAP